MKPRVSSPCSERDERLTLRAMGVRLDRWFLVLLLAFGVACGGAGTGKTGKSLLKPDDDARPAY